MTYRFLKLTTSYPGFIRQFLSNNPVLETTSYEALFEKFAKRLFYIRHSEYLQELGNETKTYNVAIQPLQLLWAQENKVTFNKDNWLKEIVFAQIEAFDPEIIYLEDLYLFDKKFRGEIRSHCDSDTKIVGWRAAETNDFTQFSDLDLMLSAVPNFIEKMREKNIHAYLLPLAFDEEYLKQIQPKNRIYDLTFLGTIGSSKGPFSNRYKLIEELLKKTKLEVWGDFIPEIPFLNWLLYPYIPSSIKKIGSDAIKKIYITLVSDSIHKRIHAAVFGKEYLSILSQSKMTVNCHINCSEDYAGNIRLYEATGMGACLITDWKKNLPDLFEPDAEVLTYRNHQECLEKVEYYLKHDEERQQIAEAGQKRTLRDHTYRQRMNQLNDILNNLLK